MNDAMIALLKANESLWDLFTRKKEYSPVVSDRYQRFPYYMSKCESAFDPKVSEFLIKNNLKFEYPNSKPFALCLTHDIDSLHYSRLEAVQMVYKRQIGKFKFLGRMLRLSKCINFSQIMDLERKYEAKSSFYFLSLEKNNLDFKYKIEGLKYELRDIVNNGWEVGLHGGHEAYVDLNEIKKEKRELEKVIGKSVVGYRNHYLRFKLPLTWELLKEAGFNYDTTFGYADCVGFRNGMCHPFKPFNLNTNQKIDILEIPLVIMDVSLFGYMHMDLGNAWKLTKHLIDITEKYNGVITILWHNTSMVDDFLNFYEKILKYCYEKNAWMTNGEEIWRWWKK